MSGFGGGGASGITLASGSWTPVLRFGGASVGITYSTQSGLYYTQTTSTGELIVNAFGAITLTSKGSSTGNGSIAGLPFVVKNSAAYSYAFHFAFTNYSGMSAFTDVFAYFDPNTSIATLVDRTASQVSGATETKWGNTSSVNFNMMYIGQA